MSDEYDSGYAGAWFDSGLILPACEKRIERRKVQIEKKTEELIADIQSQSRWKRTPTREDALKMLSEKKPGEKYSPLERITEDGSWWAYRVELLAKMCMHTTRVYVDIKLFQCIEGYL